MEKNSTEADLFKKAGVTGKISDIKGTVRFEQANENANVTVSFEKFEGITKKHGLHIHTFSNFQASGKHLGGKKIPYDKVCTLHSKILSANGPVLNKTTLITVKSQIESVTLFKF